MSQEGFAFTRSSDPATYEGHLAADNGAIGRRNGLVCEDDPHAMVLLLDNPTNATVSILSTPIRMHTHGRVVAQQLGVEKGRRDILEAAQTSQSIRSNILLSIYVYM